MAIAIVYMMPLNLNVGGSAEKPIDLAVSNIFLFTLPILLIKKRFISHLTFLGFVLPLFFITIGLFSAISYGGDLRILLSAFSFVITMFHLGVGYLIGSSKISFSFLHVSYALSIVIIAILLSDIFLGSFPRGCGYQGRWGGCFGRLELYGFPNASMNFLAVCSPLLALPFIRSSSKPLRVLALISLIILVAIVPLSLSRSALLVFLISSGGMIFMLFGLGAVFAYIILCLFGIFLFEWIISLEIFAGIVFRIQASIEAGNITTGRLGIWQDALSLWFESPVFGKAFLSFSEFSRFGTVHQQYLEVLYKTGLIGVAAYFGYIFLVARLTHRVLHRNRKYTKNDRRVFFTFGVCLFVANLFQPAISYQPLGNFMFFAMGIFLARNIEKDRIKYEANPPKPLHRPV